MPAHHRVGRDDAQVLTPTGAAAASRDPEQLVPRVKPRPRSGPSRPRQDGELVAQQQVLEHEVAARADPGQHRREQQAREFEHTPSIPDLRRAPFCRPTRAVSTGRTVTERPRGRLGPGPVIGLSVLGCGDGHAQPLMRPGRLRQAADGPATPASDTRPARAAASRSACRAPATVLRQTGDRQPTDHPQTAFEPCGGCSGERTRPHRAARTRSANGPGPASIRRGPRRTRAGQAHSAEQGGTRTMATTYVPQGGADGGRERLAHRRGSSA